jgi:hypothetical protein
MFVFKLYCHPEQFELRLHITPAMNPPGTSAQVRDFTSTTPAQLIFLILNRFSVGNDGLLPVISSL